jgi:site-specific recombinase XerD
MSRIKRPIPLFDSFEFIEQHALTLPTNVDREDYAIAISFLRSYSTSKDTFIAYRREIERLMQWLYFTNESEKNNLKALRRHEIEQFIRFCHKPPKSWIGTKKAPRFIVSNDGIRVTNAEWRPFVITISKSEYKAGKQATQDSYSFSAAATKVMLAVLSTFFNFLIGEEYTEVNPVLLIRHKSRFYKKQQGKAKVRKLSDLQWSEVLTCAEAMATRKPEIHERTLFILKMLYALYPRISELAASDRWTPKMCDFYRDHRKDWWFTTIGKGNKQRDIAVSNEMLNALKRWRLHLGLTPLPSPADSTPLLPKTKGNGPITSKTYLRELVQRCFDNAVQRLRTANKIEEADTLEKATVHWLRHTGISEDVKTRPIEHVRDDAGHEDISTTGLYIDVEQHERYKSAKNKRIEKEQDNKD